MQPFFVMTWRKARDCPALGPAAMVARQSGYSFHKSPSVSIVILPFLWRRPVAQRMSGKAVFLALLQGCPGHQRRYFWYSEKAEPIVS